MSEGLLEKTERAVSSPSVNTLNQIMSAPPEKTLDVITEACQELLREKVGERILDQIELLAGMYSQRSTGEVYQTTSTVEEYTQFATRTADCQSIEELYTINDSYSTYNRKINQSLSEPAYAKEFYRLRSVQIGLFLGNTRHEIRIDPTSEVKVYKYDDEGVAHLIEDKPAKDTEDQSVEDKPASQIIEDFFYRSLISGAKMEARTAIEREEANTDALAKLNALHASLEASISGVAHVDSPEARQRRHRIYIGQA